MALFKICRGTEEKIPTAISDGYIYFSTDTNVLYIDWIDESGNAVRNKLDARAAEKIKYLDGDEFVEIDASEIVNKIEGLASSVKAAYDKFPYTCDETYSDCFKRTVGEEVEWLNPPFVIDTEYRTSERFYGGKVLYAKQVTLKAGGDRSYTDSNISSFARVYGRCGTKILPYYENEELKVWLEISDNVIYPRCVSGYTGQAVDLLMYYVKK